MVCVCVCMYVEHNLKSSQMELGNYQCEGSEAKKKLTSFALNWGITTALWLWFPKEGRKTKGTMGCRNTPASGSPSSVNSVFQSSQPRCAGNPQVLFQFHFQSMGTSSLKGPSSFFPSRCASENHSKGTKVCRQIKIISICNFCISHREKLCCKTNWEINPYKLMGEMVGGDGWWHLAWSQCKVSFQTCYFKEAIISYLKKTMQNRSPHWLTERV